MRRENDVVSGEVLAFVELDALAQMKAPMQGIEDLPARGEAGLELHVRPAPDQPLVHGPVHAQAEALVDLIGVDRFELALEREAQDLGFGRRRQRRNREARLLRLRRETEISRSAISCIISASADCSMGPRRRPDRDPSKTRPSKQK